MVDFSFTWLSVEPSKCPSNTSDNKQAKNAEATGERVCVCVCALIPSGMLSESCSVKDGTGVKASTAGSPGDGSMEEEEEDEEGRMQRCRSSVGEQHTKHTARVDSSLRERGVDSGRRRRTDLCPRSAPPARGCGGRSPGRTDE